MDRIMHLTPFTVAIAGGVTVEIREVTSDDRRRLETGFAHLSPRSRYFRFLAAHPELTPQDIARFTEINDADHVAIGAARHTQPDPDPVGIARFIRLAGRANAAEFAITVVDRYQGMGVGGTLLGVLAKFACRYGISEFIALVHAENAAMRHMLRQLGARQIRQNGSEVEIGLALFDDPGRYPDTTTGQRMRQAYALADIA